MKTLLIIISPILLAECCVITAKANTVAGPFSSSPFVPNGHAYYLLSQSTWAGSQAEAVTLGGNLVTIRSQDEQEWAYFTFADDGGSSRLLWIGLNDLQHRGNYVWVSGEPLNYTNWAAGEPTNATGYEDYVAMNYPGGSLGGLWSVWSNQIADPFGVPFHGLVEINSSAGILIEDGFNVTECTNDVNSQIDVRQRGLLAPLTYTKGTQLDLSQVCDPLVPNALRLAGKSSAVSPDRDFVEPAGMGGTNIIEFMVHPVLTDQTNYNTTQTAWMAVTFGASLPTRNQFPQFNDGVGIFFRGNGQYGAFNDGTFLTQGSYAPPTAGVYHFIHIEITDPADGNPFDGIGSATIRAFADGKLFFSYVRSGGFTNNYISLIGEGEGTGGDGLVRHAVDDFRVKIQPGPTRLFVGSVSSSGFGFGLTGAAGFAYVSEWSTNLTSWTSLATLTNWTGTLQFVDPTPPTGIGRFYRARRVE